MGHFLLDKLMISRDGPLLYYLSWWFLEVGPPCLCNMSWCLEVGHLLETSWWGLEVGHFLLDKLMISRDGPPFYYISWWSLEVGPPCLCAMSWCLEVGPLSWWNVSWSLEVGPPIDPGLKLQYKTGLKSGWLFNTFTLWSKGGPTSMVNFSRGAHL